MQDLINERDKQEKMKHSVAKWWNVHYMTREELTEEQAREGDPDRLQTVRGYEPVHNASEPMSPESDALDAAQAIIDRLNREAAEDEARKQQEIEQARRLAEANFNEKTGAYSGVYGSEGIDRKHKEQIDAILAEKDEALRDLIQRTGEE